MYISVCYATIPHRVRITRIGKLGYVRKKVGEKMNKALAKCLVSMCKITHFHFSTKSGKYIFMYLLWDRLSICSIVNLPNTQRLQSLFEMLLIKETMNYQHRTMETKYTVLSFKE